MQNSVAGKNNNNRNSIFGRETQYVLLKSLRKVFEIQCGQAVISELYS